MLLKYLSRIEEEEKLLGGKTEKDVKQEKSFRGFAEGRSK